MKSFLLLVLLAGAATVWAASARPEYRVETMAGSSNLGDHGPATAAQFGIIQGIAFDPWGSLYVADTDHHRIRKIDASGTATTIAGIGTAGFSGDAGPAASAQLNLPYGLAVDSAGYLYIADFGNSRVRRVAPDGTIITVAGNGLMGSSGDGGLAADAQLMSPRNVAVDALGNLYISEFTGHRIRKVAPNGRISTVAGIGVAGFRGDGGPAIAAQLSFPAGLVVDRAGNIYIADSGNQRVRKMTPGAGIATVLGGPGTGVMTPLAIAVDGAGTIFVADATYMVRSYTAAGVWATVAGTGGVGFSGDGGPASQAQLSSVRDVTLDTAGGLYLADGVRVRRVDRHGIIQTLAGDGYLHAVGDGLAATAALLFQPLAVALDGSGNLYIADSGTERVRQVVPAGTIRTVAGTGAAGPGTDGVPATASNLYSPMGIAISPATGTVSIADTYNHRVRTIGPNGLITTFAGTGIAGIGPEGLPPAQMDLRGPRGVCQDRAGTVYIVDTSNHRVLRVTPAMVAETAAGNGAPGDAGDGGPAPLAQLNQPSACTLDTAGNLYLADTASNRIRKVTPSGTMMTAAGTGDAGFSGDEGPATAAVLNGPRGVAVDDSGNVFIADTLNHRIRLVTPDGVIHTIAGQSAYGFGGDGGPGEGAQLNTPAGLVLDGAGDLYFADSGNNRVRRLVPQAVVPPAPVVLPPPLSATNAASLRQGPVAPGEILAIFGQGIGPDSAASGGLDSSGLLSNLVGGAEVLFDGVPAPLFYAQWSQINLQVPYTVAASDVTQVEVLYQGKSAGRLALAVVGANPALFPVIVNQDGSPNSESSPAAHGTVVTLFATGEGLADGANISGLPAAAPYPRPKQPVTVTVAGITAELLYAGSAPGLVGELQINARVPGGFVPSGPVAVQLTVGNFGAPAGTLWVK